MQFNKSLISFHFIADEYTDRWDDAFYAAGVFIVISGVLAWIAGVMVARDDVSDEDDDT